MFLATELLCSRVCPKYITVRYAYGDAGTVCVSNIELMHVRGGICSAGIGAR